MNSEEEEEPLLRYERLEGSVPEILKTDKATCIVCSDRFVVIGTERGQLHVLDMNGAEIRLFRPHKAAVVSISLNMDNSHIASVSGDGSVVIIDLWDESIESFSVSSKPASIAIHPKYPHKEFKAIACASSSSLSLYTVTFFGKKKQKIPNTLEAISAVTWHPEHHIIAFACEEGVKVFDVKRNSLIAFLALPEGKKCMFWKSSDVIVVASAAEVQYVRIQVDQVSCFARFTIDDITISGVAPFDDYLVVFGVPLSSPMPQLIVLSLEGEIVSSDAIPMNEMETFNAADLCLGYFWNYWASMSPISVSDRFFYLLAPTDLIAAKLCGIDDHIRHLLFQHKYKTAWEESIVYRNELRQFKVIDLAERYLENMLRSGFYEEAARKCPQLLEDTVSAWERWIRVFGRAGQMHCIVPWVPLTLSLSLSVVLEMIDHMIQSHPSLMLKCIEKWPFEWYDSGIVVKKVEDRLVSCTSNALDRVLAILCMRDGELVKAIGILARLGDPLVFEMIENNGLFGYVEDKVKELMQVNPVRASRMLLLNRERVSVDTVCIALKSDLHLKHEYLHQLFLDDPLGGQKYHGDQVELYAMYLPSFLLRFLKQSNFYILEKALEVCERFQMDREMVFLLGRTGDTLRALGILVDRLKDWEAALSFVEEHQDPRLWRELVVSSLGYPEFVAGLLDHVGTTQFVDAGFLIEKLPQSMEISGLRDKMLRIVSDYALEVRLRSSTKRILASDCVELLQRLNAVLKLSVGVLPSDVCPVCTNEVGQTVRSSKGVGVFWCGHSYHESCAIGMNSCIVCHPSSRRS